MKTESRATTLLVAALVLGIGGDLLLRTTPWGLNAFLWIVGLAAAGSLTTRLSPPEAALTAPLVFFAGMVAWSDAPVLTVLNVLAAMGLLALPIVRLAGSPLAQIRAHHLAVAARRLVGSVLGVGRLLPESHLLQVPSGRMTASVSLGALVTIPISALFVSLFSQADPNFESLAQRILSPTLLGHGVQHVVFAGLFAWPAAAYLRSLGHEKTASAAGLPASPRLGLPAVAIPLTATIVIFGAFVTIQARYLFGGADFLAATPGLTTAQYARSGFFELVTATTLVVPLLMGSQWVLEPSSRNHRWFGGLATTLIALVVGVVASALHRMLLYWRSYGLSQDRVYATVFMLWIGIVLFWFAWAGLARRRDGVLFGVALSGLVALAGVNLVNVDGLVARVNIARAAEGRDFDVSYHARDLSADGVPVLASHLENLAPEARCRLARELRSRWGQVPGDWRSWNVARWRASAAISAPEFRAVLASCTRFPAFGSPPEHPPGTEASAG